MDEWLHTFWFWWGLALALFAAEALLPGAFLLWLGLAATATGLVVLLLPLPPFWQWVLFGVLGMLSAYVGLVVRRRHPVTASDQPLLNRRADQLVGRVLPLHAAIVDGRGKLKIGDALWAVEGEDLPQGARVRIEAVDGMLLRVRAVE